MKQALALRELAEIMSWNDEGAEREFAWLRLMSRLKYDGYHGYLAGVRFVESLVIWLQQFAKDDRIAAYNFVRHKLVYVSNSELRHLVDQLYPRTVLPYLVEEAAKRFDTQPYRVWANPKAAAWVKVLLRRTLFVGLSDGARMDVFRRANPARISNEQTVLAPTIDTDKWMDLQKELREDATSQGEGNPKFGHIYVIDDLTASGTSLIRQEEGKWKGKLPKFRNAILRAREEMGPEDFPLEDGLSLCVHHYMATEGAMKEVQSRIDEAREQYVTEGSWWFKDVRVTCGMVIPEKMKVACPDEIVPLTDRYYDPALETRHSAVSGDKNMRLGYKSCSLPLIMEHNTPNNTISLLWAETAGGADTHAMRPLFRRVTRHV